MTPIASPIEAAAKAEHEAGWCSSFHKDWVDVSEQHRHEHETTSKMTVRAFLEASEPLYRIGNDKYEAEYAETLVDDGTLVRVVSP